MCSPNNLEVGKDVERVDEFVVLSFPDVVRKGIWAYAKAVVDAHVPVTKQLSASSEIVTETEKRDAEDWPLEILYPEPFRCH